MSFWLALHSDFLSPLHKLVSAMQDLFNTEKEFLLLLSNSSHIQSVPIGIEYRNLGRTLEVYLLFPIWMWQIQVKLIVTY